MEQPPETEPAGAPSRPTRLNLERARAMIVAWHESGLSRAAFAEREGICLKTFDRWRGRIEGSSRNPTSGLARVVTQPGGPSFTESLRIIPGNPPQIILPADWDAACLRQVLEACAC